MAFDNPDFGRKNYEEYLRAARETLETLEFKYLTDGDKSIIERGIYYLIRGDDLLKREDPESLREAAWLFLVGGYYLGARCAVSESEAEYWRRKRSAKGGTTEKQKRKEKREAIEAWQAYARTVEHAGAETTITALAESLLLDKKRPNSTPSNLRTIEKFLSRARKERIAGDAKPIRLVHSA
jgi:hypothetical protein